MRKSFVLKVILAVSAALFSSVVLNAQRQTPGRPSLEGQVLFGERMDYRGVAVNGGTVTWNNYQYLSHTSFGVEFFMHPYDFVESEIYDSEGNIIAPEVTHTFRAYDITAGAGYFVRLLASRNRAFIFSVGISGYTGVRYCKDLSQFVKKANSVRASDSEFYKPVGYVLNVIPEAQMELFPFSNVCLFVSARPRLQVVDGLAGKYDWFHFAWGSGLKIYF